MHMDTSADSSETPAHPAGDRTEPDRGEYVPKSKLQLLIQPISKSGFTRWHRSDTMILLILLLVGLSIRVVHFTALSPTAYMQFPRFATQTDMYAVWEWSGQIVAGDLLGRDTYHPDFAWMQQLGDREDWTRWWGSWEVFQQEPAYPYFVATLRWLGLSLEYIILVQLLIGSLQGITVYLPARLLGGRLAGLVAGLVAVTYGPLVFNQGVMLRDWLEPLLMPLLIWGLLVAQRRDSLGGRRAWWCWLLCGIGMGALLWTRAWLILMLPVVLLWAGWSASRSERARRWVPMWRPLAVTAAGIAIGFAPLVTRNAIVGAPLMAVHNRGVAGVLYPNLADSGTVGLHLPRTSDGLEQARGSTLRALWLVGESHEWQLSSFADLGWTKFRGLISPKEIPNNVSLDYARRFSPILAWLPDFSLLWPASLAGVGLTVLMQGASLFKRAPLPITHRELGLLVYWLGMTVLCATVTMLLGRYRLGMVPPLAIIIGLAVTGVTHHMLQGAGWKGLVGYTAAAVVCITTGTALQAYVAIPSARTPTLHNTSYTQSSVIYDKLGQPTRAYEELQLRLQLNEHYIPNSPASRNAAGDLLDFGFKYAHTAIREKRSAAEIDLVLEELRRVHGQYFPDVQHGYYELGGLFARVGDLQQASAVLQQGLERGQDGPFSEPIRDLLGRVRPALNGHPQAPSTGQ